MRRRLLCTSFLLLPLACQADAPSSDEGETGSDDATTSAETSADTTTDTGDGDGDGDGDGTGDGDGDQFEGDDDPYEVVECETLPSTTARCEVTTAGSAGLLVRGDVLAPETVYRGGAVLLDADGVIQCVGCDCADAEGADTATVLTCADAAISPGLINGHDHITYANNPPMPTDVRYDHRHEWRTGANGKPEVPYDSGASANEVLAAEMRFVMSGTTSAASAGGRAGLMRNVDSGGLYGGLAMPTADSDTFPLGDSSGALRDSGCDYPGPTPSSAIDGLRAYLPHVAEGTSAAARNEFGCTSEGQYDVLAPQSAFVHAIALHASDVAAFRSETAKLLWSPRSNVSLYGDTAPVTLFDSMGVPIALGTDWVVSGSGHMLRELACARELNETQYNAHFSDLDLFRMVTTNASFAVGGDLQIGMLKPGYVGDLAIFDASSHEDYAAVSHAELEDVVMVLRGGEVLYGDAAAVEAVRPGCETADVCGVARRACVAADLGGTSYGDLRTAIASTYPLELCGVPAMEPTCVPSRPGEYEGLATDGDMDGDGIADADDNCRKVFNPIREFETVQSDVDQDGIGDVCDACPTTAGTDCVAVDADDLDGDGIFNGSDNCPLISNAGQADADADGKGDDCDVCPQAANPGGESCVLSIPDVRDPATRPPEGSQVEVRGVYVTAVRPDSGGERGFYVEDGTGDAYSGILIFTGGTSPNVEVGNRVTIRGTYTEFFDTSEIENPDIVIEDASTTLPFSPLVLTPAELANATGAEVYESMLVRVESVSITNANPDAPNDYDEFTVTGGLRIDDFVSDDAGDTGLDNNCAVGTTFTSVTGISGWSFGNRKLFPRDAADFAGASCDPFAP